MNQNFTYPGQVVQKESLSTSQQSGGGDGSVVDHQPGQGHNTIPMSQATVISTTSETDLSGHTKYQSHLAADP